MNYIKKNIMTYKLNEIYTFYPEIIIHNLTEKIFINFTERIIDSNINYKCKLEFEGSSVNYPALINGDDSLIYYNISTLYQNIYINEEKIKIKMRILVNDEDLY